jgi:hypothetical protein
MQNLKGYHLGKTYGSTWALGHANALELEAKRACSVAAAPLYMNADRRKDFDRGWRESVKRPAPRS